MPRPAFAERPGRPGPRANATWRALHLFSSTSSGQTALPIPHAPCPSFPPPSMQFCPSSFSCNPSSSH
eukprot:6779062-Pyramimonas_sp.AAC.1